MLDAGESVRFFCPYLLEINCPQFFYFFVGKGLLFVERSVIIREW